MFDVSYPVELEYLRDEDTGIAYPGLWLEIGRLKTAEAAVHIRCSLDSGASRSIVRGEVALALGLDYCPDPPKPTQPSQALGLKRGFTVSACRTQTLAGMSSKLASRLLRSRAISSDETSSIFFKSVSENTTHASISCVKDESLEHCWR